jgi:hypothetical protein
MTEDPNKGYKPEDIQKLHAFTGKFFYESFLGFVIIGVPVFVGVFVGKKLDVMFDTGKILTIAMSIVGLVIGWVVILRRNKIIVSEYREIRKVMEANKTKIND